MATFSLKILDKQGNVKCEDVSEELASLVFRGEYEEGDRIAVSASEKNLHVWLQLDDAMGASFVYLKEDTVYTIPFGEKRSNLSPKAFSGDLHYLYLRPVQEEEIGQYRNLAGNVYDQHGEVGIYPHASANVETRGEAVFAAKNAIDGVIENRSHGLWPYASWGINRQDDAEIKLDFGRKIETDKIILFTRADFPHDNWWTEVTFNFSDGTVLTAQLEKSRFAHVISFERKQISWVKLGSLVKADDPSPFPALTQIEVYGTVLS